MDKEFIRLSDREIAESFRGYVDNNEISDEILAKVSRDLGFSFDLYNTLSNIDSSLADQLVLAMCKKSQRTEIAYLVDRSHHAALGYALDTERLPMMNEEFIKRVRSLAETSNEIKVDEIYLTSDDRLASVMIKKVEPLVVDLGSSQTPYHIGVLLVNNELDSAYCRLAVYEDGQPVYLPASYYNLSSNRYKKSTGSSDEAIEVLMLRIIDDLRETALLEKVQNYHLICRKNKEITVSYEEYNTLLRAMMKIPSIIDDRSFLEKLTDRYNDFEKKYAHLDDQKSSYIWRCTAMGELNIGTLVHLTSAILGELGAPVMEYYRVRETLGNYLSTKRIASEIALEDM